MGKCHCSRFRQMPSRQQQLNMISYYQQFKPVLFDIPFPSCARFRNEEDVGLPTKSKVADSSPFMRRWIKRPYSSFMPALR